MHIWASQNRFLTHASSNLKLNAWTCAAGDTKKYRNGTCGDFYMAMIPPETRVSRKQLGTALDYLNASDAKFIGCLGGTRFSKRKVTSQAAIIMPDNRLYLQRGDERVGCGLPQTARDDFAVGAHVLRWHYPDIIG